MNDIKLTLENIEEIINEAETRKLTLPERAALFAAMSVIAENVKQYIDKRDDIGRTYARDKINGILWHVGAALGFDVTNDHPPAQHRVWAKGDLESLKKVLLHDT